MKKVFSKQNIMPTAVLLIICLVSTVILALLNMLTAPVVEAAEKEAIAESLRVVLPGGEFGDPEELGEDVPDTVTAIYRDVNGKGHVVTVLTRGYVGDIAVTVGVDSEGKVIKAVVTKESESHGKAGMDSYTDRFTGLDSVGVADAELFSGATISSTAIKGAVSDAMIALGYMEPKGDGLRSDVELIAEAMNMVAGAVGFTNVTENNAGDHVKKIFRENSGKGYVIYANTYAQYGGGLETETLIAVDSDGVITNVNNLYWKVGHNVEIAPPPPPSEEKVKEFFDGFIGADIDNIGSVELVADATGTANNVRMALTEALEAISESERSVNYVPRIIAAVVLVLSLGGFVAYLIVRRKYR